MPQIIFFYKCYSACQIRLERIRSFSPTLQGNCCLSEANRDKFMQISMSVIKANNAIALSLSPSKSVSHQWLFSDSLLHAFTATAGSAAERKVRDPEEPGALLLHLCRCDGIQGRKARAHTRAHRDTHRMMSCPLR